MSVHGKSALIVKAYATALYNAGKKAGVIERLIEECETIGGIIAKNPAFQRFLESPQIATQTKHDLVNQAFQGKVNPMLLNVLYMMIDRERAILLGVVFSG